MSKFRISMSFIHCIEIFQKGYKEGSDRVRKGKAI